MAEDEIERQTCTFFLAINEEGGYVVDEDAEDAATRLSESHGGNFMQTYEVTLYVPHAAPMEITATVPAPKGAPVRIEIKEKSSDE